MAEHDLVVRGGTVIDGTGTERRTADVAISQGVVTDVGRVDGRGARELDADGLLVTPGIVDIHCHYDGQATWDSRLQPSSWHGVTTVVMSNCGVGFAPVRSGDEDRLIELMEGVEDIPGAALHEGLSWEWRSFGEYLDAVDALPHDVDVAAQLPHGALRLHVMGERGAAREPATPDDIARMAELAAEAMEAGALGFTTSRTMNHRSSKGELTPSLTAEADELVGIAMAMGQVGKGVLQVVSDFRDVDFEFGIFKRMTEESGRPISMSLAQAPVAPDHFRGILDRISAAQAEGLQMRAQVAARGIGVLLGLQCTLNPFMVNPVYKEIADLPLDERVRTMRDPAFRERLLAAETDEKLQDRLGGTMIKRYRLMFELADPPDYEPPISETIEARAARAGVDANAFIYDLLLQDDGKTMVYVPFANYVDGSLSAVGEMLAHPYTVPGLSDGGAHVGTICDGSFPTTLLRMWGRDRAEGRLPLEHLVQRHCQGTAATVGLLDRGVLAPGYRADLNLIDFERLQERRPEMHYDLPAGGKRLLQRADGYVATVVRGEVTYEAGEPTDALPGRLVRGATPAPT
ncbi:MAG TPA: amidohydrolase family protein [Acidimicrobiales bacterium]|nr:amidohydrolase family protein [Acidimicrobiales bacterium]